MKIFLLIIFCFISLKLFAQDHFSGSYYNSFGSRITLDSDSSFKYNWNFDLASSWTTGKWKVKNDTIYLTKVLVYDTLRVKNENDILKDSLVLSSDEKRGIITNGMYVADLLTSGGQNRQNIPCKLYYKNNKLFEFNAETRLIKKRVKGFWTNKKVVPWYRKIKKVEQRE